MDPIDLVTYAARQGIVLSYAISTDALAATDRAPLEAAERARYRVEVWDGTGNPPIGQPDRWVHGLDGPSKHAQRSFEAGGVVYFIFRDGGLMCWQPYRADGGPSIQPHMVHEPGHPDHWEDAAAAHLDQIVAPDVDAAVLRAAMGKALALHEERQVPYHAAPTNPLTI